jgi:iron complex outermembrane receptor protein
MEYQIRTKMKLLCLALAAAVSMPYAGQVAAQDLVLEEIVVTAQRRQESLQEVPISVSSFDEETLEKANISEAKDYLIMSPNVGFTEDGQTGSRSVSISIRGVASIALDTVANPSSIGYYVDELSVATTANGNVNPQLQDMQRIEVLRGSQGTYFGRNALGGAINITTQKPNQDFYAEATMNAGEFSTRGFEGIVNVPVSDTFMLRAMGAYEESEGPVENINPNSDNDTEFTTFRGAARWNRFLPGQ